MTQALITGGTGFIGSHVARRLLSEQVQLRCLVRPGSNRANLRELDVEFVEGDLNDAASLRKAVAGCEMLFHVAADYRIWARYPEQLERTNVEGSRNILQAAADAGVKRVVFTSSVAAVGRPGKPHPQPLSRWERGDGKSKNPLPSGEGGPPQAVGEAGVGTEELDPTPDQLVGPYKRSKFASDLLARGFARQGLSVVIVNPSAPVGSHDIKPTPTGKMILDFLNRRMPAYIDTGMNFVDVEDVAAGHWLAAQKGQAGERYILGNRNMTLKEFLENLAAVAGLPAPRIQIPYGVAWMAGAVSTGFSYLTGKEPLIPLDGVRMAHEPMYYDASKAVRELGLPQTPIQASIKKAVDWFRQNNYLR